MINPSQTESNKLFNQYNDLKLQSTSAQDANQALKVIIQSLKDSGTEEQKEINTNNYTIDFFFRSVIVLNPCDLSLFE